MSKVQIYIDETYGFKKSFLIQSAIWGNPVYCDLLQDSIGDILTKHSKKLGPGFKELHAMNVNQKNWKVFGPVYEEILDTFFQLISQRNLGLLIVVMSKDRFDNNAGYLVDTFKQLLPDRSTPLGKLFSSFQENDLPAVYYRIHQLFLLFKYRNFFGREGDVLESFRILQVKYYTTLIENLRCLVRSLFHYHLTIWK
jgi:hypothetical protein